MIRFYDFEFNPLHFEPDCISMRKTLKFNGVGNAEAHFPLNSEAADCVLNNRYLVMEESGTYAVVTGCVTDDDFAVYGRTCNWLLSKRIAKNVESVNATCDEITRNLVSNAFSDTPNFVLGDAMQIDEKIDFAKDGPCDVLSAVTECLSLQKCGHRVDFDVKNKRWVYRNLPSKNTDLLISVPNKNSEFVRLESDILDLADCGYYKNSDGEAVYIGGTQSGIFRWESELKGSDETTAAADLMKKTVSQKITLRTFGLKYGADYELGDIVRVQFSLGGKRETVSKRICGAEIVLKSGACSEQPVFEEV